MSNLSNKIIKEECTNNSDGLYITKEVYENGTSCIRYWDKNENNIKCEFFIDNNFKNLEMTSKNKFHKNGSYVAKQVYTNPTLEGYQSIIGWYDSQNQNVRTKEFSDNNFKKLIRESKQNYDKDGTHQEKVYGYINQEYYINSYNTENKILTSLLYTDKHFLNLFCTHKYTYNDNGDYKIEEIYKQPVEDGWLCYIGHYNDKKQLIS